MTRLHCINLVDRETGVRERYNDGVYADGSPAPRNGSLEDGARRLEEAEEIGGHNILQHDIPAIRKVFPWFAPKGKARDSLLETQVIFSNIKDRDIKAIQRRKRPRAFVELNLTGKHSLEAWGYRLGNYKGDFKGPWDAFTPVMDDYCAQDVDVTRTLFDKIDEQDYSRAALDLEHEVREIINLQENTGFLFDRDAAIRLEGELTARLAELGDELRAAFPPWFTPERKGGLPIIAEPKRNQRRKVVWDDGRVTYAEYSTDAPYCKVKLQSFEPSSRDLIANRLTTLFGWVPQEFTDGGKPKVDETTLDGLQYPEAKLLKEYLTVEKRLGQLSTGKQAWLKKIGPDGRIHGRVNTVGAVTRRMTHMDPNLAQVPKVKVKDGVPLLGYEGGFGYECRSLFIVPKGKALVGVDAEGLELRMKGHYLARYDNGAFIDAVINGSKADGTDVHTVNQRLAHLNLRDSAKTLVYAYLYGAGDWKLGVTIYDDFTEAQKDRFNAKYPAGDARDAAFRRLGRRSRNALEEGVRGLKDLQKLVREKARRGYVLAIDGGRLHVRSQHASFNTLLQGGGAIVMKKALVLTYRALLARGWEHGREFAFVANIHDEFQMEVDEEIAEEVGAIAAEAIRQAGVDLGIQCPLAGSAQIGKTWADSH